MSTRQEASFEARQYPDRGGDTSFAAITHVLALVLWVIGPAVALIATDDRFVEENARNALNWQLSFTIYMILSIPLVFAFVGLFLIPLLAVLDLVFCIIAASKASDGEAWKYPITVDFV